MANIKFAKKQPSTNETVTKKKHKILVIDDDQIPMCSLPTNSFMLAVYARYSGVIREVNP